MGAKECCWDVLKNIDLSADFIAGDAERINVSLGHPDLLQYMGQEFPLLVPLLRENCSFLSDCIIGLQTVLPLMQEVIFTPQPPPMTREGLWRTVIYLWVIRPSMLVSVPGHGCQYGGSAKCLPSECHMPMVSVEIPNHVFLVHVSYSFTIISKPEIIVHLEESTQVEACC